MEKRLERCSALAGAARLVMLGATVVGAQAALAGPPELRSEGGLLVLPNVRVEQSAQPVEGRGTGREAGMKAYKDQETGKLRKATQEELQIEAQTAPRSNNPAGAKVTVAPNGRKSGLLDDSFMSYSVVRKGEHGKLETMCVTGETEAHKALQGAPVAKEDRHAR
jgi:hypothetical protein